MRDRGRAHGTGKARQAGGEEKFGPLHGRSPTFSNLRSEFVDFSDISLLSLLLPENHVAIISSFPARSLIALLAPSFIDDNLSLSVPQEQSRNPGGIVKKKGGKSKEKKKDKVYDEQIMQRSHQRFFPGNFLKVSFRLRVISFDLW